jgi:hypothetical protein
MSTRCTISFTDDTKPQATIYRHSDGYPDGESGVISDLQRFFNAVKAQCTGTSYGTRFDDPPYLAAKFVVWQAGENARNSYHSGDERERIEKGKSAPLAFGSLGIVTADWTDAQYKYVIHCDKMDENGFPTVTLD